MRGEGHDGAETQLRSSWRSSHVSSIESGNAAKDGGGWLGQTACGWLFGGAVDDAADAVEYTGVDFYYCLLLLQCATQWSKERPAGRWTLRQNAWA